MISPQIRAEAKRMYLNGARHCEIARCLKITQACIRHWSKKEKWSELGLCSQDNFAAAQLRLNYLINKKNKEPKDFKEMKALMELIVLLNKQRVAENPNLEKKTREKHPRYHDNRKEEGDKKPNRYTKKNDFREFDNDFIIEKFENGIFDYQFELFEARHNRIRNILKSRQIGLTWYFAREAFFDALTSGDNQIFLSASRAQADVFREYIKGFALEWFDKELSGKDKITIITNHGPATMYFLSTSSTTAQSYHGHLYIDEYFWIPKFDKLNKVASAMASHAKWRKTYFSTPSTISHSAYPFWSGDQHNEMNRRAGRALAKFPEFNELRDGIICPDSQYRRIITIDDAVRMGCNLFNIEQLKLEYFEDEFKQLFLCQFIDDTASVFKLSELEKGIADSSQWEDFKADNSKPYLAPVWIGYDPSRVKDGAAIVVIAPPLSIRGKFRVLERIRMFDQSWQYQCQVIKELTEKYRVDYIGIDLTGPGSGVFEQVKQFFPCATPILYTPETKTRLVLKAQQVITDERLIWDAQYSDIPAGFLQIKKTVSQNGQIAYIAQRTDTTGHADSAWAIMHALINEGILSPGTAQEATVVIG